MANPNPPPRPSYPPPHTCPGCSNFTIYLPEDTEGVGVDGVAVSRPPNPSQEQLACQLYGDEFWGPDWTDYRNYFFQITAGISFFLLDKENDVRYWARRGCLLAHRFVDCLGDEDEHEETKYALGVKLFKETGWSAELGGLSLPNIAWEILLAEEDEDPGNVYSMLAETGKCIFSNQDSLTDKPNKCISDSDCSQIINRFPINMQPSAVETLTKFKVWLEDCLRDHRDCQKPDPGFTPTRLLQIGPQCRLREMGTQIEPYAALSYCWGGDQVFKTTKQTLPQYLKEIDSTKLPQTLQDAIYVAQQLGLRYIWIDALCIIQDSIADKAIEIGQMARVYGNSTITIGATRASAVKDGFLGLRSPLASGSPNKIFSLPCKQKEQDMGTVILLPFTAECQEALDTRGWTFQERVLSPRIIDFGTLRTTFTCQKPIAHVPSDGWSHLPLDRPYGKGLDARLIADLLAARHPPEEMLQHWKAIVEGFTSRGLAFATDKLPAIAGMAECIGEMMKDEYCAGLWRNGMPGNLLWKVDDIVGQIYHRFHSRLARQSVAAPSWSWAAVGDKVIFEPTYTQPWKDVAFSVDVEGCEMNLADARVPYGAVSSGKLILRASAQKAIWNVSHDPQLLILPEKSISVEVLPGRMLEEESTAIPWVPDALEEDFEDDPNLVLDVWLLLFGMEQPRRETGLNPSLFGLVVRRRIEGDFFSRVGVFHKSLSYEHLKGYMAWFQQEEKRKFVIV